MITTEHETRATLLELLTEINAHTFVEIIEKYHIELNDIKRIVEKLV